MLKKKEKEMSLHYALNIFFFLFSHISIQYLSERYLDIGGKVADEA